MHCFISFTSIVALLTVASAAGIRPILSISRGEELSLPLRRAYQEQDTARAFYSYGYSDENAARAEYTTRDGSSRGFYSYVDANGKLQTVKYEAGGLQGFKAEASNQPKAPVDDKKPPLPVTETREVQEARAAHLDALREAQEEEARHEEREKGQERGTSERALSDEDADILERVRAELTSMLAERQREESRLDGEKQQRQQDAAQSEENAQAEDDAVQQEQEQDQEQREEDQRQQQRLQTAQDAKDLRLRTVYTLEDINSSSYLKLSDRLQDRLDRNNQELRVPTGAYYSYASPNAKYSVTTPTELRTLRPVALSRSLLLSKQNQNQNQNKK
ncbi:hypothetical protein ACLKA6_004962 [Drosophila palustris]